MENMKKFNSDNIWGDPYLHCISSLMGWAKQSQSADAYKSPHGEIIIKPARNTSKKEREAKKPYPGCFVLDNRKYYILYK